MSSALDRLRAEHAPQSAPFALALEGRATVNALAANFCFELSSNGRFRFAVDGFAAREVGFDGTSVWTRDLPGVVRTLEHIDRERALLLHWFLASVWLEPTAPLEITAVGEAAWRLALRGGLSSARVELEPDGGAQSLRVDSSLIDRGARIEAWLEACGRRVPSRFVRENVGVVHSFEVTRVRSIDEALHSLGERPGDCDGGAAFDGSRSPELAVRTTPSGHLLVRPVLGGRDLGEWIFDTGAGVTVMDSAAIDALGLSRSGRFPLGGGGANTSCTAAVAVRDFRLGPLQIADVRALEMPMKLITEALGSEVAGIVGWDVLTRAITRIDARSPRIAIQDASRFDDQGLAWRPLVMHGRHPHVRARYEGEREGLFRLDTGAGAQAVFLHSPTVLRERLLDARATREIELGGAGGRWTARLGALEWFEFGERRIHSVPTIFNLPGAGAMDDPFTDGTLGAGVFGEFELVLDYARGRIAFAQRRG